MRSTVSWKRIFGIVLAVWIVHSGIGSFLVNLGSIALARNNSKIAEDCFLTAIRWDNQLTASYWGLGHVYQLSNKLAQSQHAFGRFLETSNDRHELAHFFLGNIWAQLGNREDAIREWRLARTSGYFERAGQTSRYSNDWESAVENYEIAYQIDPRCTNAVVWMRYAQGKLAGERNDPRLAAQYFQMAVVLDPQNFDAYLALGVAWLNLGRLDDAEEALRRAYELRNTSFWSSFYLGKIQYRRGNCTDAIILLREAAELNMDYAPIHISLARSYRECGYRTDAILEYRESLQLDPDNVQVQKELDNLLR